MSKTLDWENLKTLNCHKCFRDLGVHKGQYLCECGFRIGIPKLMDLAVEMCNDQELDNFKELVRADS